MAGLTDVGFQSVGLSLVPVSGTPYPGANLISVLLRCHGYTLMDRCSTASSASRPRCQQVVINNGWVMDRPGRGCRSVRSDPGPGLPKAEIPEVGEKWGRTRASVQVSGGWPASVSTATSQFVTYHLGVRRMLDMSPGENGTDRGMGT